MYFLILLKRANVPARDIICFYLTCIRPVLDYCAPLYHYVLPDYLCNELERIQKRALSIILPSLSYCDNFSLFHIDSLKDRRIEQCHKFFESIVTSPEHKLQHFLPPKNSCSYNLRYHRQFTNPITHTKRFSCTFLPTMCRR